jgi:hypothetical protein
MNTPDPMHPPEPRGEVSIVQVACRLHPNRLYLQLHYVVTTSDSGRRSARGAQAEFETLCAAMHLLKRTYTAAPLRNLSEFTCVDAADVLAIMCVRYSPAYLAYMYACMQRLLHRGGRRRLPCLTAIVSGRH